MAANTPQDAQSAETADMRASTRRYFYFVKTGESGRYLGKCLTTRDEIAATFRHYSIEGNTVTLYSAVTKVRAPRATPTK